MQYHLAPLFCRPWTLNGITPRLIESHYEGNYGSALRRLNAITEELEALDPATTSAEGVNRLKRDEAAALNSALLHQLSFASLGGDGRTGPAASAAAPAARAEAVRRRTGDDRRRGEGHARLRRSHPGHRRAAATLYDAGAGHHGRRRMARSRAARRVDRRAVEDRPGRHLLRLRLPCRLRDGDCAPPGRLRRALPGRGPLRPEGDRGERQSLRGALPRVWQKF